MSKNTIIISVIVVAIAAGIYFLFNNNSKQVTPTILQPVAQTPSVEQKNVVALTDAGYSPAVLTIQKGETVVFKNESSDSMWTASAMHPTHTAYSGTSLDQHCPDTAGTAFDACRAYLPGGSWSFVFNKVGSWKYHNHLNTVQWGTIVVR